MTSEDIHKISTLLIQSLGECKEGNDYEIVAKDGVFWINHKVVGSGEPLGQWIEGVLKAKRTCAKCGSGNVIILTADLDICNSCGFSQTNQPY